MNNKIKELILQAGIQFDKDIDNIDVCVMLPVDLEKFAELIIKECANVVAENFDSCEPWMTPNTITRHFGLADEWSYDRSY